MDKWTDKEIDRLQRAIGEFVASNGKLVQRQLARDLHTQNAFPNRSIAAIYIRIREMSANGGGWWSNKPVGHKVIA